MEPKIIKLNSMIISCASVTGETEHEGLLGEKFDMYDETDRFSMNTWEKSESEMQRIALSIAIKKGKINAKEIGGIFAGDLLNQCVGSAYGLLSFDSPYFGLYSACATCAQGLLLSAMATSAGQIDVACAITSSHNCSAERQYRTPVEYGGQKPPTAQWTVTGAGAFILKKAKRTETSNNLLGKAAKSNQLNNEKSPMAYITEGMGGIVKDSGISDANNMGAAMAPAAADTMMRYFKASSKKPSDFDMILTGDLGEFGSRLFKNLLMMEGYNIENNHNDCGCMIYKTEKQMKLEKKYEKSLESYSYSSLDSNLKFNIKKPKDKKYKLHDVNCGGSGCGCSASVLAADILPKLEKGELKRVVFLATGAMMSPSSVQQGLTIPAIAHLVLLESPKIFNL